jgi:retron-type reverse transcriptase
LQEGQYEVTVPTVADRVAQTVAAMALEARTESIFHEDSYGYRPRRRAGCGGEMPSAVLEERLGD